MRETDITGEADLVRLTELEGLTDDASQRERADIMLSMAAKIGWHALLTCPDVAPNFLVCDLHTGDPDLAHAVVQVEVRWRAGQTPAATISELRREIEQLRANARDQVEMHRAELAKLRSAFEVAAAVIEVES